MAKKLKYHDGSRECEPVKCLLFFIETEITIQAVATFTDSRDDLLKVDANAAQGWELPACEKELIGDQAKKNHLKQHMIELFQTAMEEAGYSLKKRNSDGSHYVCFNLEPIETTEKPDE